MRERESEREYLRGSSLGGVATGSSLSKTERLDRRDAGAV